MITIRTNSSVLKGVIAALFLSIAFVLQAERDAERIFLARLSQEIEQLEHTISSAEAESVPVASVRFRYDWLRRDLKLIQSGIDNYLTDTHLQPRSKEELQGIYHQ